jgi:hypothetical protein
MNRDVFLSLLALDAYNRGYGEKLGDLAASGKIGEAYIQFDSLVLGGTAQNRADALTGFYAIAYEWNGKTIISYRGTNFPTSPGSKEKAAPLHPAIKSEIARPLFA